MIKNQKQAAVAKERLAELNQSLTDLYLKQEQLSLAEFKLGVNSLSYSIENIKKDINEYEFLTNGDSVCFEIEELSDINKVLISARIAKKMSHKQLGDVLGIQEQQIQRYEASDYESATWTRIQEVAFALGLKFEFKKVTLTTNEPKLMMPAKIRKKKTNVEA